MSVGLIQCMKVILTTYHPDTRVGIEPVCEHRCEHIRGYHLFHVSEHVSETVYRQHFPNSLVLPATLPTAFAVQRTNKSFNKTLSPRRRESRMLASCVRARNRRIFHCLFVLGVQVTVSSAQRIFVSRARARAAVTSWRVVRLRLRSLFVFRGVW